MRKQLVVFTERNTEREVMVEYFRKLFNDAIDVVGCSIKNHHIDGTPPIVLAVESTIDCANIFFPNSKIIFISRSTSNENIEKLIMLPEGTRVLVANEPRSAAIETIEHIKKMGITHLDFVPYWTGSTNYDSNIDIVVYTGYKHHCPPGHSCYINLGYRDIKLTVISAIIDTYNLPYTILDDMQNKLIQRYVNAAYKINANYIFAESTRANFEKLFQISENVLLVTDNKDNVAYFNDAASYFFEQSATKVIGKNFYKIFNDYPSLLRLYASKKPIQQVTSIKKNRAVVDLTPLNNMPNMNILISIIPASEINRRDAQLRTDIKESGFHTKYTFDSILGTSNQIRETIDLAHQYAKSDASIFISGESGTGKELFAQAIHNLSARSNFPFVSVNCAALPESLAESELFGYDEGAFTGASKRGKEGKFELAHRGTIFLDEIGDAPLSLQTKLLRVIEEQEVVRIGSNKVIPIDARIICASNRNLKQMVNDGLFRQDLYYRINVLPLQIPSLRERREDIPILAESIFDSLGMGNSKLRKFLIQELLSYEWPGNVRELRSAIQLLSTLSDISNISFTDEINEVYWRNVLQKHFNLMSPNDITPPKETNLKDLVLQVISKKSKEGISFGRGSLLKDITLRSSGLTEYRLKQYIAEFAKKEYITIGSTKQGMRITEKGINYLSEIN